MAKVRGIGVAVIAKISGLAPFWRSFCRWFTPKRCCSSMMAKPKFLNSTSSWIKAWVPITMSISPALTASKSSLRTFLRIPPTNRPILTSKLAKNLMRLLACCSARISVGAIKAAWWPEVMVAYMAIAATTVFPLPTSPCNNRFICQADLRLAKISLVTRFWAPVSSNGNCWINSRTSWIW